MSQSTVDGAEPATPPQQPGPGYWQSPDGQWWPAERPPYEPPSPPSPGWWQAPDGQWYGPDRPPFRPGAADAGASRGRRPWIWVVVGIGVVLLSVLIVIGLEAGFNNLDVHHDDLTQGHGDFPTVNQAAFSTRYAANGYHVAIHEPNVWVPAGVEAPSDHAALTVEVRAAPVRSANGAALGPWCWHDIDHGFGILYETDGHLALAQHVNGGATILGETTVAPWRTGQTVHLLLSCDLPGLGRGRPELAAYLNGKKVLSATATDAVSTFRYTGFMAHTAGAAPAEWVVREFWRRGPGGGIAGS